MNSQEELARIFWPEASAAAAPSPGRELTGLVARVTALARQGELQVGCPHLDDPSSEPCVWLAWAPGLLLCPACAPLGSPAGEDMTCAECGRRVVGEDQHSVLGTADLLLLAATYCDPCYRRCNATG